MASVDSAQVEAFIARWSAASPSERANAQPFLLELCDLLAVPRPDPAPDNGYSFEFVVTERQADGSASDGRMDLYKRACFVLEAKHFKPVAPEPTPLQRAAEAVAVTKKRKSSAPVRGTDAWDDAIVKARGQAERYVRALPPSEPNPPFLIVVDVGHTFELFADFTQAGKAYLPFPDPRGFRIRLADLRREEVRERLRQVWTNPLALDPARRSAAVTREVSGHLATLATSLEKAGHPPKAVAEFLSRCLFCMFAEDVGLLPDRGFTELLNSIPDSGEGFVRMMQQLFAEMQKGTDFSVILRRKLLRFNGGLFEDCAVLPVNADQLALLRNAARQNWRNVEPAIFGTLLERALGGEGERHKLGAHFTPRAYVERLVLPTVMEPLRAEWESVRAAAVTHARAGNLKKAGEEVLRFHDRLCATRVLDPACGSGNFLYVALEHMKRLEGEVLDAAAQFGENLLLELSTHAVDPHQFLGLEINPRAAAITELVLWIGYLQWHFRTRGQTLPAEPVLKKFRNIECRDAVLACDDIKPVTYAMAAENPDIPGLPDAVREECRAPLSPERGRHLVTVWDRKGFKTDPVTGRDVPDETKRVPLFFYANPRPAVWPEADFIVGNPPFLGKGKLREAVGDGYAETLRETYPAVPESADFVLYWWHKAAELVRSGKVKRFGLITTNSLRQTFARRVVEMHLNPVAAVCDRRIGDGRQPAVADRRYSPPLSLLFAIADHPWVDTADGAAVRIAMTVGAAGKHEGELLEVTDEQPQEDGSAKVSFASKRGSINADITVGAKVADAVPLKANEGMTSMGVMLAGRGFVIEATEADSLGAGKDRSLDAVLRPICNGKDLLDEPRNMFVIDFTGLSADEARKRFPALFQILLTRVKPEREQNRDQQFREKWWLFGRWRPEVRAMTAGLSRYIATVETAKHRLFQFLSARILPEHRLIAFGTDDAFHLGVLSSRIHVVHALAAGGTLEDRPVYNKSRCFDPFPFPACDELAKERIRKVAEELDAHRKRVQAQHPGLTLTGMYNVLEKLRAAETSSVAAVSDRRNESSTTGGQRPPLQLTAKEKLIHDQGLVSVLKQLHDELDAAVFAAYGWPATLADAEILERLVALNAERAREEANGVIRWLRPEYQMRNAERGMRNEQTAMPLPESAPKSIPHSALRTPKSKWPKALSDRVQAVESALRAAGAPVSAEQLAKRFQRAKPADVAEILETLVTLGRAHRREGGLFAP